MLLTENVLRKIIAEEYEKLVKEGFGMGPRSKRSIPSFHKEYTSDMYKINFYDIEKEIERASYKPYNPLEIAHFFKNFLQKKTTDEIKNGVRNPDNIEKILAAKEEADKL